MSRQHRGSRPPRAIRPLPLLDTLRRGVWGAYARAAVEVLGGEAFTATDKKNRFIAAYLVRFGFCPETGRSCELGLFPFENEVRYANGQSDDVYVLKQIKSAGARDSTYSIVAEQDGTECTLFISPSGAVAFRAHPLSVDDDQLGVMRTAAQQVRTRLDASESGARLS